MIAFRGDKAFLSNFYPCEVYIARSSEGGRVRCPSVEHGFQALKSISSQMRLEIIRCSTPANAKRFARSLPLRPDWEEKKIGFMRSLLIQKFSNPELAQKLLSTGTENLVELNEWHDNFWGSCTCPKCGNKGQNQLGKLLMEIRSKLLHEDKMESKEFMILEGIELGNRFFTKTGYFNPEIYKLLGYADSIEEAQFFLYGRIFTKELEKE